MGEKGFFPSGTKFVQQPFKGDVMIVYHLGFKFLPGFKGVVLQDSGAETMYSIYGRPVKIMQAVTEMSVQSRRTSSVPCFTRITIS